MVTQPTQRLVAAAVLAVVGGCAAWRPPTPPPGRDPLAFGRQFDAGRSVPADRCRRVTVVVLLPAYGVADQLRAGHMGHAAIEFDGRLHDMGSLNGYAFTFRPSTAVRFWPWPTADAACAALVGHPDADGWLDRITRFDVTVTDAQAAAIDRWWAAVEARMADPDNRLYFWANLQCASCVAQSLWAAGVTRFAPLTPDELDDYLRRQLRDTAGPTAGSPAVVTTVQKPGHTGPPPPPPRAWLLRWPSLLAAGQRSPLSVATPNGPAEPILWSDGPAYHARAATFAVGPADAVRRAGVATAQPLPDFAVGRWYHIAAGHVIGQADVGGPYVNGDTGAVVVVDDRRVIRFDAFAGDRIVVPVHSR